MKQSIWNKFEDYSQDPPDLDEFKKCIPIGVPITEEQKERCYHYYNARGWVNVRNIASAVSNWVSWQRDREARMAAQPTVQPRHQFPPNQQPQPKPQQGTVSKLKTRIERLFGMTEAELMADAKR